MLVIQTRRRVLCIFSFRAPFSDMALRQEAEHELEPAQGLLRGGGEKRFHPGRGSSLPDSASGFAPGARVRAPLWGGVVRADRNCLLYTSDAADDLLCVDLGGRRI